MATILRNGYRAVKPDFCAQSYFIRYASSNRIKEFRPRKPKPQEKGPRIDSFGTSLENKGYLRPYKPYDPPSDFRSKIEEFAASLNISQSNSEFESKTIKYEFLNKCFEEFKHIVPNSKMHEIKTVADVIQFYQTPLSTTVPLDALKTVELPENLHVQYDYHRFHPDTDTMFGGQTAFPKSHTIVTGLKYKDKYRSLKAKTSWP